MVPGKRIWAMERLRGGWRPEGMERVSRCEVGTSGGGENKCTVLGKLKQLKAHLPIPQCHQPSSHCLHEYFLPSTWFERPVLWGVGSCQGGDVSALALP